MAELDSISRVFQDNTNTFVRTNLEETEIDSLFSTQSTEEEEGGLPTTSLLPAKRLVSKADNKHCRGSEVTFPHYVK